MTDVTKSEGADDNPAPDRPRGILTRADRELLMAEDSELSRNEIRDARYRIRNRIKHSFRDFEILLHHLDSQDRKQVFEDLNAENPFTIVAAITFFYLGNSDLIDGDPDESFGRLLSDAIPLAERKRGYLAELDSPIKIDRKDPDVDQLVDQLCSGEGTLTQFNFLIERGRVQPVLENIIETGTPLELWENQESLEQADEETEAPVSIWPLQAKEMLEDMQDAD